MCGIAGIYNSHGLSPDRSIIAQMSASIAHRGPDAEGFHVDDAVHLAARRLSIIDLKAGPQPIYNQDKTLCIVFNGEIYNYQSLRKEIAAQGYAFQTKTDTEVVLAAYSLWGNNCVGRLKGMFAFCIRDQRKQKLLLVRDRFGIKPLYTARLPDGTFLFASEIKALLQHPALPARLYPRAVDNLLTYGFNTAPHTFFDGIKQVLPGHFVRITPRGITSRQYWDINLEAPLLRESGPELAGMFSSRFEQAVRESLAADVPVAAYLSGGIDSSAVTGVYSRLSSETVKTVTITFDDAGYDESAYSRMVSAAFGTENVEFKCRLVPEDIKSLIYYQENPLVSLLSLPLFLLSRMTRQLGIKVVLSGDGADEILGGYDYFKLLKAMAFIKRSPSPFRKNILRSVYPHLKNPLEAASQFVHLKNFSRRFPVANPAVPYRFHEFQLKKELLSPDFKRLVRYCPADGPFYFDLGKAAHRPLIDQALYIETKMRLLNLTLPLSDTMSMANAVEMRPLFLDHDFVDFVFRLPHDQKIRGLSEKHILKQSMRGLLPEQICTRKKQPLQPPGKWFVETAGELLREYLAPDKIRKTGYFNPAFIDFILTDYYANPASDYSGIIVVVFFMQLWHDIFLGKI